MARIIPACGGTRGLRRAAKGGDAGQVILDLGTQRMGRGQAVERLVEQLLGLVEVSRWPASVGEARDQGAAEAGQPGRVRRAAGGTRRDGGPARPPGLLPPAPPPAL